MATILAPQFGREVLRCNHCDLVQFPSSNELCRRCRQPYDRECSLQADPTEASSFDDGLLQVREIRRLPLKASLVNCGGTGLMMD